MARLTRAVFLWVSAMNLARGSHRGGELPIAILIGSLLFLYWVILPVVVGALADIRGYQEDALGALASLYAAGMFVTTASSMLWIQRANWVWLVRGGSALSATGFAVLFIDDSYAMLAIGHLIASVGLGLAYAVIMAVVGDQEHPARGYALVFFLQVVFGVSASAAMTTSLSSAQIVATSNVIMIGVGILCALLAGRLPQHSQKTAPAPKPAELVQTGRTVLPPLPIVLGLLAILLVFTGDAGVWIFLERIGSARSSPEVGGLLVSVNLAAGACGSLTAAWVSERLGYLWPMVIAIGLSLVSVGMMAAAGSVAVLVVASFVNGWSWNFGAAYRMGLVSKLDVSCRFTVLIPSMQTLGNSLGPLMTGLLIVRGGYNLAFLVTAGLWVCAFAAYYPAWKHYKRMSLREF